VRSPDLTEPYAGSEKGESMSEPEYQQIVFEIPPEVELSEEELAKLIEKFRIWLIDVKPREKTLQTKVKQVQAVVRKKVQVPETKKPSTK